MKADAIAGYRIERLIGKGGMASVYLATQQSLDRPVALKVLREPDSKTFSKRFINEGRIIASLSHPNIITVYDVGIVEGLHYISMEYVEGGDLKQRISEGISTIRALKITQAIAACLDFAHGRGIIHRDVKPANILFRADGTPVLTDFGIAKQFESDTEVTITGTTIGTPYYISPEQAQAESVDGRTDIYSLGVIFYEMLTGKKPYVGDSDIATLLMHIRAPIPKLPSACRRYQILLDRMIAKDPQQRFANAGAVVDIISTLSTSVEDKNGSTHLPRVSGIKHRLEGLYSRLRASKFWPNANRISTAVGSKISTGVRSLLDRNFWSFLGAPLSRVASVAKMISKEAGSLIRRIDWSSLRAKASQIIQDRKLIGAGLGSLLLISAAAWTFSYINKTGEQRPESQREPAKTERPANEHQQTEEEPAEARQSAPINDAELLENPSKPTNSPPGAAKASDNEQSDRGSDDHPEQATDREIEKLLELAQKSLETYRLTTPPETNALHYYEKVLDLDPKNKEATLGFSEIATRYSWLVAQQIEQGDYGKAREYLNRGLQIDPGNPSLIAQRRKVENPDNQSNESLKTGPIDGFWGRMKNLFR